MAEMKDTLIEQRFRAYFAGLETPAVDLTAAKRALKERPRRRARLVAALSSLAACFVVLIALAAYFLPAFLGGGRDNIYRVEEAAATSYSYTELKEKYPEKMVSFASFSLADNVKSEYYVYTAEGKGEVLLKAELGIINADLRLTATVWLDLSEGEYVAEELAHYEKLESRRGDMVYSTGYVNGEYVSQAFLYLQGDKCYIDTTSQSESALGLLVRYLRK